ncbi:uncharacterized protein ASPGLDRAFT_85683 [Aspergillus glaucus CBS 516.65]|uniref:Uncharacterized protein n=1 Tax=Aspergillus glaucus CBS 516.65 TaxID=1160497 RepID=A0A1L9V6S0_ASPGL|nr:hypothetical protein ASPGLDRAFT_85683 [Aspergillus glaucus CBS 516.65]OJJ79615.1 hypothetical protein ASPGLDRAFT_85683 [Aspergillus glaucus CBS 516.65]
MRLHITTIAGLFLPGLCSAASAEICTSRDVLESLNKLELDAHRSIDIIRSEDPDSNIVAKHPPTENTFNNLVKYKNRDLTCTAAPLPPQEQQVICHQYNEYAKVQIRPFHTALHEKFFYTLVSNSSTAESLYNTGETFRAFILPFSRKLAAVAPDCAEDMLNGRKLMLAYVYGFLDMYLPPKTEL